MSNFCSFFFCWVHKSLAHFAHLAHESLKEKMKTRMSNDAVPDDISRAEYMSRHPTTPPSTPALKRKTGDDDVAPGAPVKWKRPDLKVLIARDPRRSTLGSKGGHPECRQALLSQFDGCDCKSAQGHPEYRQQASFPGTELDEAFLKEHLSVIESWQKLEGLIVVDSS